MSNEEIERKRDELLFYLGVLLMVGSYLRGIWWGLETFIDEYATIGGLIIGFILAVFVGPMAASIADIIPFIHSFHEEIPNEGIHTELRGSTLMFVIGAFLAGIFSKK